MAVVPIDGNVRVSWLNACANINLPTAAELNAGTALEGFITPDGLNLSASTGTVDTSNLGSTFTTGRAGRRSYDISLKFHHDSPTDTPFNLLPYRTSGFLAVRRGIAKATAWTASQRVEIYPVETMQESEETPGPDGTWDFTTAMVLTSDAQPRAVVA
jgi:hypothetical protein